MQFGILQGTHVSSRQSKEFAAILRENGVTRSNFAVFLKDQEEIKKFCDTLKRGEPNFIVRVNRSVKPTYPDWMKKLMHPEMELLGPAEYDLSTVELWLHDDQKDGIVTGNAIYEKLKKDKAIADCLGLADLLAIQSQGITVFRKFFAGKAVFGWKSVVQNSDGGLSAPYLIESDGEVVLSWFWLGLDWNSYDPALRFRK